MQLERRLLGNAASLGIGALLVQIANFGFVILVARGFGREVFAQYALSMAIGGLICVVVSFGSISLLIRASAQDQVQGREILAAALPVQIALGACVLLITVAGGLYSNLSPDNLWILGSIVGHHIILRITGVVVTQLQGMERMDIVAVLRAARSFTTLILGFSIALATRDAVLAIASMPIASFLFLLVAVSIVRRLLGSLDLRWDRPAVRNIVVEASPFFGTALLNAASSRLGILMLSGIQGNDSVATYASGERIIAAAAVLYSMLTSATLPAASRLTLVDRERHAEVINRLSRIVILLILPAATLLFLFSGDIVVLLFGPDFLSSVPILEVMASVLTVRALFAVQVMVATSIGRQRDVLIGRVASLVLLVSSGFLLIRLLGPLGLAYAVLVAEVGQAAVLHVLLNRAGVQIPLLQLAGATLIGCAITMTLGLFLPNVAFMPRAILIFSCMLFALWAVGAVRGHDIRYLLAILKTERSDHSKST